MEFIDWLGLMLVAVPVSAIIAWAVVARSRKPTGDAASARLEELEARVATLEKSS
jgi:uncharacterized membrane protein